MSNLKSLPIPVGVDLGAKTSSIYTPFGSLVMDTVVSNGKSTFVDMNGNKNDSISEVYVGGEHFTVGESSTRRSSLKTFGTERLTSKMRTALLYHLLKKSGLEGRKILLVHSVPTTLSQNQKLVESTQNVVGLPVVIDGYAPCTVQKSLVLPEATSSVWSMIHDQYLNTHDFVDNGMTIVVIDIGGYTVDINVVSIVDGKQLIDNAYSKSYDDYGVISAFKFFSKLVNEDRAKDNKPSLSPMKLKQAFEQCSTVVQGEKLYTINARTNAVGNLAQRIYDEVIPDVPIDADLYCFCGGGVDILKPYITGQYGMSEWFERIHIPNNPVMSCVQGNYNFGLATLLNFARKNFGDLVSVDDLLNAWQE
jgi:hypothetical protein